VSDEHVAHLSCLLAANERTAPGTCCGERSVAHSYRAGATDTTSSAGPRHGQAGRSARLTCPARRATARARHRRRYRAVGHARDPVLARPRQTAARGWLHTGGFRGGEPGQGAVEACHQVAPVQWALALPECGPRTGRIHPVPLGRGARRPPGSGGRSGRRRHPYRTTAGRRVPGSRWAKTDGRRMLREHGRGSRR